MRISEARRVLQRTATPVRAYPDVNGGEQIFCEQLQNKSYRKRRKSGTIPMCELVGTTTMPPERSNKPGLAMRRGF